MRRIIGIGETILDILFKKGIASTSVPGGSTFNSMISLGRIGIPSCFVSEIGDDAVGRIVRSFLSANGVDDKYLTAYPEHKSPISLAFLDDQNNATYSFYKEPFSGNTDWQCPTIRRDDIILFGSYYALDPHMRHKVIALLNEARSAGAIIYYDINFRRNHQGEAIKLMGSVIENLEYADIVRGSDEDFSVLYRIGNGAQVYSQKTSFYCPRLIYSRGDQGVELHTSTIVKHYPIEPIVPVSTIGAGDNLNAGILYGIIRNRIRRDDLDLLTERDWDSIIRSGIRFSADVCSHTENYISQSFAEKERNL